jgi:hypothetical protein
MRRREFIGFFGGAAAHPVGAALQRLSAGKAVGAGRKIAWVRVVVESLAAIGSSGR